jgi:hypothetical protein
VFKPSQRTLCAGRHTSEDQRCEPQPKTTPCVRGRAYGRVSASAFVKSSLVRKQHRQDFLDRPKTSGEPDCRLSDEVDRSRCALTTHGHMRRACTSTTQDSSAVGSEARRAITSVMSAASACIFPSQMSGRIYPLSRRRTPSGVHVKPASLMHSLRNPDVSTCPVLPVWWRHLDQRQPER